MGKKKDKQKKAKEKDLNRRAAEFADEVRTPANEGRATRRAQGLLLHAEPRGELAALR